MPSRNESNFDFKVFIVAASFTSLGMQFHNLHALTLKNESYAVFIFATADGKLGIQQPFLGELCQAKQYHNHLELFHVTASTCT